MKKFYELMSFVTGSGEMNIYRRILRTALFGTLFTFLAMLILFLCSMFILRDDLKVRGKELAEHVGENFEELVKNEFKKSIAETTLLRARLVQRFLNHSKITVEMITRKMTEILKHPDEHIAKKLPVANFENISENTTYIFYTPKLLEQGISENLNQEILRVSSIDDDLENIGHFYGSVVIASEKGYVIRIDAIDDNDKISFLCKEPLRSTYDHKERDWYKKVLAEKKSFLTDPYLASYGKPCVSICAPYYDGNNFAGVIAFDIDLNYISERMTNSDAGSSEFSFILGKNGEILVSPQKERIFSAGNMDKDLGKSENKTLTDAAVHMVASEKGIAKIEANGKKYYLAYAPVGETGWSLGTVVDKNEITDIAEMLESYTNEIIEEHNDNLIKLFLPGIIFAVFIFVIILYFILEMNIRMAKGFAAPINLLTQGVQEIAEGNLKKNLEIKTVTKLKRLQKVSTT